MVAGPGVENGIITDSTSFVCHGYHLGKAVGAWITAMHNCVLRASVRALVYATQRIDPIAHDNNKITNSTRRVFCPTDNNVFGVHHCRHRGSLFLGGATKRRFSCTAFHFGGCTAGADRPTAPCMVWFNAGRRESREEGGWRRGSSSNQRRNRLREKEKERRRHGDFVGARPPSGLVPRH